jgi:hypothetical protein
MTDSGTARGRRSVLARATVRWVKWNEDVHQH